MIVDIRRPECQNDSLAPIIRTPDRSDAKTEKLAEFLETFRNKVIWVVESENYIKTSGIFQRTSKIPKNQYFLGFCYHSETWKKYKTLSVFF